MTIKPRLYLDSCCFIDLAKGELNIASDADRSQDIWYLQKLILAAKNDEVALFTSTLTIAECTHVVEKEKNKKRLDDEMKRLFRAVLTSGRVVALIQPDVFIAEDARDLRWDHDLPSRIKGADLVHFASAGSKKCSEFLTTEFSRKNPEAKAILESSLGLQIIPPSRTNYLPTEYLQEKLSWNP